MYHVVARIGFLCWLCVLLSSLAMAAEQTITLPPASALMLLTPAPPMEGGGWAVRMGGIASSDINVGSLWAYDDKDREYWRFMEERAHAVLAQSAWLRAESGRWFVTVGSGQRSRYIGNRDAGQLWINLHAADAPEQDFTPTITSTDLTVCWAGLGRRAPVRVGVVRGEVWLLARVLQADELRTLSGTGIVAQSDFTGMVRQLSSSGSAGVTRGQGWALDAGARLRAGRRWEADITVEGLRGQVRWPRIYVTDELIVTPQVYEDPDGFLHDFGGITGMSWREDLTLALEPAYQLDLLYHGSVTFTAGVGIEDGEASPRAGAIIPLRFGNLLLRAYPDNRALEIGATGKGWLIALHADDMPGSAPSVGTLVLGIGPVAF